MGKRRDILFVSSNFPPVIGGSTVVYDQICRNAADRIVAVGSRLNLFTGKQFAGLQEFDDNCPYRIHRRSYLRPPVIAEEPGFFGRLYRFIFIDLPVMLGSALFLFTLIARYRIKTVCLGELVYSGWLVFPLRYLLGRKVILYTHGEEVSQEPDCALARLRWLFLRHANAIVAVSLFCKSQIVSLYGVDARRIFIIPNGVDLQVFQRGDPDPDVLPEGLRGHPVVLSVSRLVARKGQEALIRAFPAVLEKVPDARCAIVGTGQLAGHLRDVTRELGLEERVFFLGSVPLETLARLYRTCDLFALPCRTLPDGDTEGFGLVFLEANACGMPVIAGAAGGTVEAVIDGETGLIVDGNDVGQIADAVAKVLGDGDLARRLGERGWSRAQSWGWGQVSGMFVSLCESGVWRENVRGRYAVPSVAVLDPVDPDPKAFVPRLLVTVDVEEEFDWERFSREDYRVHGVEAIERYHADCVSLGISPVYFATYPMIRDLEFGAFFERVIREGTGEVGIHVHSWMTPPFWEQANSFNSYQCNLPLHIERAKIEFLSKVYEDRFRRKVPAHRAGRWGGSSQTGIVLEELGIPIDFSPSSAYVEPEIGAPDFANLDGRPFWAGPNGGVLTLPASSVKYLRGPKWVSSVVFSLCGHYSAEHGWGKSVRFSSEGQSEESQMAMVRQFSACRLPVVVSALHSTSLYPGGNPYSRSPDMAEEVRARTISALGYFVENGWLRPTTPGEVLNAAWRERPRADQADRTSRSMSNPSAALT